jgi:hypothetical protein
LRLGEWSESRAFQVICETTAVVIQGRTARVHQQAFGRDKPAGIWLLFPNQHGEVAIAPRGGKPILPSIGRNAVPEAGAHPKVTGLGLQYFGLRPRKTGAGLLPCTPSTVKHI